DAVCHATHTVDVIQWRERRRRAQVRGQPVRPDEEGRMDGMDALARRFQTLRWRLMLSCFVAAFTAMMTLEGTFVIVPGIVEMTRPQQPAKLVQGLQKLAPRLALVLRQASPDGAQLVAVLASYSQPIVITEELTENFRGGVSVAPGKNAAL